MPVDYRLCAIDLDDTLLGPDHKLSARNARVLQGVVNRGVVVLIASGRMYVATLPTARQLHLDSPIICYNGALVKHPRTGETWMERCVPSEPAGALLDYCRANRLQLNFYWQDLLYTAEVTPWLELYHKRTSAPIKVCPEFYSAMRGRSPTKLIIVDDPSVIDRLLPEMRDRFGELLYVTKSNAEYLEFLPPGSDKGAALAFVAGRYGIRASETIAFGDSWNDLPMLEWAGLSIAVGNAKPEVIAAADRTVLTSAEDGVGIALEEIFGLKEDSGMALLPAIDGNKKISLADFDPDEHGDLDKSTAQVRIAEIDKELCELQELLYAAQETPVLIVLQGLDTSGKDGTINHAMSSMNPQSCRVASFKVPTPPELAHDFLWRVHSEVPSKGGVVIFNRSHYEDVLVVRVHKLISGAVCRQRYDHINNFERLLADSDTLILKFFLHISKDEQEQRLLEREKDPTKAWKLSPADWKERELWDSYQSAYEDAINHCARPHAPWYIVPANHKWFRNLAIAETLVKSLRPYRDRWMARLKDIGAEELKALRAMRQTH